MNKKIDVKTLTIVGLMAALVFVGTSLRITIPLGFTSTMLHFGNVFCILGGLLFGGIPGGLAAGIGSAVFDLSSEYAAEAPITFLNKFAMGFVAGFVAHLPSFSLRKKQIATVIAAICASATYIVLYMLKNYVEMAFILRLPTDVIFPVLIPKLAVSATNGLTAVVASVILCFALRPALDRARLTNTVT